MNHSRTLLRANAAFSAAGGAAAIVAATFAADSFGLEPWFLAVVGLLLGGYGIMLFRLSRVADTTRVVQFATAMDVAWVVGAGLVPRRISRRDDGGGSRVPSHRCAYDPPAVVSRGRIPYSWIRGAKSVIR